MANEIRRYGSLSDWLFKFVADVAQWKAADWRKREQIEMALRLIRRLEDLHDKEQEAEEFDKDYWRRERREQRLRKKKATVVKLVPDGKDAS
jgi:hypothetical protein